MKRIHLAVFICSNAVVAEKAENIRTTDMQVYGHFCCKQVSATGTILPFHENSPGI